MGAYSTYKKFDLNGEQVTRLKDRFGVCANAAGVVSVVFQPTGHRRANGLTHGRIRVLIKGNPQIHHDVLLRTIKDSVADIFASAIISVTNMPASFEKSLQGDGRHFDAAKGYHEYRGFPIGRDQASGAPVRFDYNT